MEVTFFLGLAVAFGGALLLAIGSELQSRAVHEAHGQWRRFLTGRRWYAGLLLLGIAMSTNFIALALAPVSVVQSVSIVALAASAGFGAVSGRVQITRNGLLSIALCILGTLGFIVIMAAHTGETSSGTELLTRLTRVTTILATFTGVAIRVLVVRRFLRRYVIRLLGLLMSAMVFGCITTVFKILVTRIMADGFGDTLSRPTVLLSLGVVVVAGVVANLLLQSSHLFFPTPVVIAAITIIDPLTAAVVGITVLGEASLTPLAISGLALSGAIACFGVLGVSRLRRNTLAAQPETANTNTNTTSRL